MTVEFLKHLLHTSGNILEEGFGSVTYYETKQDQSNIVTEYDLKSENLLTKIIQHNYRDHNILAEENGFINNESEYCWVIDPLDGTSNYAAGVPWFGVLIALLKNNEPIISGAYLPMSNELYYAVKGQGAYMNESKICVSSESDLKNMLCCYSLDYSPDAQKTEGEIQIIKKLVQQCRNLRSTNCLIDFCFIADGKLGATINQTMKIWDIAAPHLILEEAGAKVTDILGNRIVYSPSEKSLTKNYSAVAANPTIHEKVMDIVSKSRS